MPYAHPEDYTNWADDGTTASAQTLSRASAVIDELTIGVVYERAGNGPSDDTIAAAFRDATCAQAAWFLETGDTTGAGALFGGAQIGSLRLGTPTQAAAMPDSSARRYAPEAVSILRTHGLLARTVEYT